jgi:hypothetical protein
MIYRRETDNNILKIVSLIFEWFGAPGRHFKQF